MSVILPYIAPLLLLLETNTEAKVDIAGIWGGVDASSRTQERRAVSPGTTPPDPRRARGRSGRIDNRVAGRVRRLVQVRRPFPNISKKNQNGPILVNKK